MTRQPYQEPKVYTTHPGYQINTNVGGKKNIYVSAKSYKYFFLAVYEATNFTFSKFIKKKSEALPVFIDLVTLFKRQYNINVWIFYTDFEEFNSAFAKAYFAQKRIK